MMSQKSESFFNRQQAYIKKVKENMSKIGVSTDYVIDF